MCDNLDVPGKERCAMEWLELKYSSMVTWARTCQLDSNICPLKRKRSRGPPRATNRPSFRKR